MNCIRRPANEFQKGYSKIHCLYSGIPFERPLLLKDHFSGAKEMIS